MRRHARLWRRRWHDEPPRLVLRFATQVAVVLALGAAAILAFVHQDATRRAEEGARFHAQFIGDTILRDRLTADDFARPVTDRRRAELDRLFSSEVLVAGAMRVKLYDPHGLVTYSDDHPLIGTTTPEADEIEEVSEGKLISDTSRLNHEGGDGEDVKVLEAYVPVHMRSGGPVVGVFELYQDYAPVARVARQAFVPVAGVLATVLLALYLALIPILRRTTRRLRGQMDEIRHQAFHDALTGLPNRALFHDRVEQALQVARRASGWASVMLIDLDRFKEINDTLGHQSGDEVLRAVAERLRSLLRASDTVARLGGDEFGILAPGSDTASALVLAEKLREEIALPIFVAGLELQIDASIGIAVFPDHGSDCETLVRYADVAMYLAKQTHQPTLYLAEHDHYSPERLALVGELRRALAAGELVVHFQPQADLASGRIRSVEALVRWQHPERGLLSPDRFVPLAEHTGLIRPLTRHVLDTALRQCRTWLNAGVELGVAVNVSGRDLLDLNLPDEVAELLAAHAVDPGLLELEITENTILTDPTRARAVLMRLSELGVSLAIDDFGSGHSSLGYLKRLPVQVLKIDKSFVIGMGEDENDDVIVRSTIDLGHNLGLRVVAEGVEDAGGWHRLGELGCDTVQGYHLGRPMPAEELEQLLERHPERSATG